MEQVTRQQLISISEMSRSDIERLVHFAHRLSKRRAQHAPLSFVLGILFFQESTRTQIGFQTAAYKLGGQVFTLKETKFQNSMSSAESMEDTVQVLQAYSDIICLRNADEKIFLRLKEILKKPIINCGNGFDEHPSQALTDLLTIKEYCGTIDNLSIALVGDLRYMRTAHSLLLGLSKFSGIKVRLISPTLLSMPKKYKDIFNQSKNTLEETDKLNLKNIDVIYMAGFAPKTPIKKFSKKTRGKYQINKNILAQLQKNTIILCPLPRIDEIAKEIDQTKFAKYFEQSEMGLYMRMAILKSLLKKTIIQ